MVERRPHRLGLDGTHEFINDIAGERPSHEDARNEFFLATSKSVPNAFAELRADVLPRYSELRSGDPGPLDSSEEDSARVANLRPEELLEDLPEQPSSAVPNLWEDLRVASDSDSSLSELASFIERWGEKWNLTETWIYDRVLTMLDHWRNDRSAAESLALPILGVTGSLLPEATQRIELDVPKWDPVWEREKAFRDRAHEHLEAKLDALVKSWREQYKESELQVTPSRRELELHSRWLALYQVGGLSFTDIARREGRAESEDAGRKAVSSAVHNLAEFIELSLRPPTRGGRPRRG